MPRNKQFFPIYLLLTGLVGGLGGCAGQGPATTDETMPPPVATPEPVPEDAVPTPDVPQPPPEFSLRPFIGVVPQLVEERFGAPGLVRREAGAEVWQYVSGPCVLLFFIYDDPEQGRRVDHAEARTSPGPWGEAPPANQACLEAFGSTP